MRLFALPLISGFLLLACAPKKQPLELNPGQHVTKVMVRFYRESGSESELTLTLSDDIKFVVDHLHGLDSRKYAHSSPKFNITLFISNGEQVRLRVGKYEIGPNAPASAKNYHWFPSDTALYDFLSGKVNGVPDK